MKGFFSVDGALLRVLNKVMYIVEVNLLFLLCCIPIITIGASATAMYTVLFKFHRGLEPPIIKTFFGAFKSNFKTTLKVWIPMLVITVTLLLNFYILNNSEVITTGANAFRIFLDLVTIIMLALWVYLYPAIAFFDNNIWGYLSYSAALAVTKLPRTILLMVINVVPIVLIVMILQAYVAVGAVLLLCLGFTISAYPSCMVLLPMFSPEEAEKLKKNRQPQY